MTDKEIVQILRTYPSMISKDVFRKLCQISPYHAQYLLESHTIASIIKPTSTHKYMIPIMEVINYLEDREVNPERYLIPAEYRKRRTKKKLKRPTKEQLEKLTDQNLRSIFKVESIEYPDLMTIVQVSEFTGYSSKTISRWCHEGLIFTLRSRGKILFPKSLLLEFMVGPVFRNIRRKSERHWEMLSSFFV